MIKKLVGLQFEDGLTKKVYREGCSFLERGDSPSHWQRWLQINFVNLNNSGVRTKDLIVASWEQFHLPWSEISKTHCFCGQSRGSRWKAAVGLDWPTNQKRNILSEQLLEKEGGRFYKVVFEDETTETHAWTDEGVEVDALMRPRKVKQTITVHYKRASTSFDVPVNQTSSQRILPKLSELKLQSQSRLYFCDPESKKPCWLKFAASESFERAWIPAHKIKSMEQLKSSLDRLLKAWWSSQSNKKKKKFLLWQQKRLLY